MNSTYIAIDLKRQVRDVGNMIFMVGLPLCLYLLFGNMSWSEQRFGNGTVNFYLMVSMALYGAAIATVGIAGTAAVEAMQGWGRQISLTKQRPGGFTANKVVVAMIVAAVASGLVFVAGWFCNAKADNWLVWAECYLITLGGSALFACYGVAAGMWFRSETAVGISAASLVFLGFFGSVFTPLSSGLLNVARFTPMYGYASLAKWPLTDGKVASPDSGSFGADSLWAVMLNYVAWFAIFAILAVLGMRKAKSRQ